MKAYKKIISFILTLVMMLSLSVNVSTLCLLTKACRKLLKKVLFQMHMPDILGAESH